jgi:hypothetical protein
MSIIVARSMNMWHCKNCGNQNQGTSCSNCGDSQNIPGALDFLRSAYLNVNGTNNGVVINQPVVNVPFFEMESDPEPEPSHLLPPPRRSWLMSTFLWGCNGMLWVGMLSAVSVFLFFAFLVWKAYGHAHGL